MGTHATSGPVIGVVNPHIAVCLSLTNAISRVTTVDDRGLSEAYRRAVEGHTPWTPDTSDPEPVFVPDASCDASLEPYLPALER